MGLAFEATLPPAAFSPACYAAAKAAVKRVSCPPNALRAAGEGLAPSVRQRAREPRPQAAQGALRPVRAALFSSSCPVSVRCQCQCQFLTLTPDTDTVG